MTNYRIDSQNKTVIGNNEKNKITSVEKLNPNSSSHG